MKTCSYCGAQYSDEAVVCTFDDTPLAATDAPEGQPRAAEPEDVQVPPPKTDLSGLDMGFEVVAGFSRPDWKGIAEFVADHVPEDDQSAAWNWIAAQWLNRLVEDLGGEARFQRSANFFCVSDLDAEETRAVLANAESALKRLRSALREAAWSGLPDTHVLLLFADREDYLEYVSYFSSEGHQLASWGMFFGQGYAHIAMTHAKGAVGEPSIARQLFYDLVSHLPLPTWLAEGLADSFEPGRARGWLNFDADLVERHHAHWNATNIQSFWAGTSFRGPGDEGVLSFSLGRILVTLLSEKGPAFIEFVKNAQREDAGDAAAERFLGQGLGQAAAVFLGSGDWRPNRQAMAQLWEHYGKNG